MKKRINAVIPEDLYIKVMGSYGITEAVVKGLELLMNEDKLHEQTKENYETQIEELQDQIRNVPDDSQRITDLKEQIKNLQLNHDNEINLLVDQLKSKDIQIKSINETLQQQIINVHSIIQENNKLSNNIKLLTDGKKKWWKFW